MADNDIAKLVAQVEAKIDKYEKTMSKVGVLFDKQADLVEKRSKTMTDRVNAQFGLLGSKLGKTLVGGAAVLGIERFVSSIVKAAGDIKDTADALGVGTDQLQEWGTLAAQNGIDQETFNGALEKFSKRLGEAALQGGQALKNFQSLGVNVKGNVSDAFYQFADAVANTKDQQQKVQLVTDAFGKSAAKLTPILAQGSRAIKEQGDELRAQGRIIQQENIDKIDALGDAWTDLKRQFQAIGGNILGGFLGGLDGVIGDIKSPEFQTAMKTFATSMGEVAGWVVKMGPYLPALAGVVGGAKLGRFFGPGGAAIGAVGGGVIADALSRPNVGHEHDNETEIERVQRRIEGLNSVISARSGLERIFGDSATTKKAREEVALLETKLKELQAVAGKPIPGTTPPKPGTDRSGTQDPEAAARALAIAKEEIRVQDMLANAAQNRADIERSSAIEVDESRRDAIRAQDAALQQEVQGTRDYFAVSAEIIKELTKLDLESIDERKKADLAAIEARKQAELRDLDRRRQDETVQFGHPIMTDKQYADERAAIEKSAADQSTALAQATSNQKVSIQTKENADLKALTEEQTQDKARAVQLNDTIRGGFEDIGIAALHGFGSAKQALGNFLEQLAEAILQMYVLKPLLDSLLGDKGTSGGGILGSAISAVSKVLGSSGFASGTQSASPGWHWVGEKGPELMRLPGGTQVLPSGASLAAMRIPSMPKVSAMSAAPINVNFSIDARGAQEGVADQIDRKLKAIAPAIVQAAVSQSRKEFPSNMKRSMRDTM